ncbi:PREDICTED: uncharacterized protein LOC106812178 isoform X2 [Priapulus caudatus]|uniref:Uncharacterized protein LOC106812178 isoform X2 n=1 Tax=Priapulus caudatus TaxID=37621 RepID=A0ABM1EH16_PRICU|nr:PREDICTED: uncharacterized protein LOC106812178 isoform X2 [Priapulus caudatus]
MDGAERPTCSQLLQHPLFTHDGFAAEFLIELKTLVRREIEASRRMRMSARSGRDANPLSRRKVKKALHKRSHVNLSKWHQEAERKSTLNLTKERFMPPIHNATQPRMENRTSPSKQPKDAVVKATEAAKQARRDKAKEEITLPNLKETNEVVCRAASKPSKKAVPMMPHITTLAPFSSSQVSPKKLLKRVGVKPASDGDDRIEDQEWM